MSFLALVRHGQSQWNADSKWTGWTDVELTSKGEEQARDAAEKLQGIVLDKAYTSQLKRALQNSRHNQRYARH